MQLCSWVLVGGGQNIKEAEAWRSPGRWQAKQVVLCLAQHIWLLFAAFIVMDWQTMMEMGWACCRELHPRCWWGWCSPCLLWHCLFTTWFCSVQGISFRVGSVSDEALGVVLDELSLDSYLSPVESAWSWHEIRSLVLVPGKSWAPKGQPEQSSPWLGVFFRGRAMAGSVQSFGFLRLDSREAMELRASRTWSRRQWMSMWERLVFSYFDI